MSSINAAALLAVLPHVSTEASRPIINGFLLRRDGLAIATNGHTLAAHRNAHDVGQDVILQPTKELIALAKKAAKVELPLEVAIDSTRTATVTACGMSLTVDVVEGPFPNVSQVFPKELTPLPAIKLDPKLLAKFPGNTALYFSGDSKAILVFDETNEDFIGLLMPMRRINDAAKLDALVPSWITEPAVEKAAKAA